MIQVVKSETGHNYIENADFSGGNMDWSYEEKHKAGFTEAYSRKQR